MDTTGILLLLEKVILPELSFGEWLKRRRNGMGLTQRQLAAQINCSTIMLKKVEAEERRPSAQIVERLAEIFNIAPTEQSNFLHFARGDWTSAPQGVIEDAPWRVSPRRSNLPAPPISLIGRERELVRLSEHLSDPGTRLITLTGPPGIGKTRLSVELAREVFSQYPDGVFFIALAPLNDPNLVAPTIVQVLGFAETKSQPPLERLKDGIGDEKMLLVLDNIEHLIEETAALASDLLLACPHLNILATSREALRVPGEWLFPVPVLSIPTAEQLQSINVETASRFEALTLFAERARAVSPNFALNADNVEAIAHICAQLDGLPLAIELIASRIRLMLPQTLLERLRGQFTLYADGMRAVSARHKTLHNAIAWSYNLLSSDEQKLFAYLSVFAGSFNLKAAESILSRITSEKTMSDLIASLLDKSLLQRTPDEYGEPRFAMLVTIQQFALDHLRRMGIEAELRGWHLAYFLDLGVQANKEMHGPARFEWLKRLEVEHDNLRAAIGWSLESNQIRAGLQLAGSLASFWHDNGHVTEGSRWLDKLLKADISVREEERAKALLVSSTLSRDMGDYARARVTAQSSIELYREIGSNRGVGLALVYLGAALDFEGRREEAIESLQEGLRLLQSMGERWEIALAHLWLGDAWFRLGDTQRAATNWEESLGHAQELGDDFLIAWSLGGLADVARQRGDYKRAVGLLKEALSLYQKLRNKAEPLFTLEALGLAAVALGELQRAARLWGAASVWREMINEPLPLGYQKDYAETISQARAQLGENGFLSAWSEGRAMTMEQAIELAMSDE